MSRPDGGAGDEFGRGTSIRMPYLNVWTTSMGLWGVLGLTFWLSHWCNMAMRNCDPKAGPALAWRVCFCRTTPLAVGALLGAYALLLWSGVDLKFNGVDVLLITVMGFIGVPLDNHARVRRMKRQRVPGAAGREGRDVDDAAAAEARTKRSPLGKARQSVALFLSQFWSPIVVSTIAFRAFSMFTVFRHIA